MIIIKTICLIFMFLTMKNFPEVPKEKRMITVKDIFNKDKTIIESHRGINREIFENTLEAFIRAINYGIDSIETDVWLSKDNVLVIYHGSGENGQLEGFYDHNGNITELEWNKLSSFRTIINNLKLLLL